MKIFLVLFFISFTMAKRRPYKLKKLFRQGPLKLGIMCAHNCNPTNRLSPVQLVLLCDNTKCPQDLKVSWTVEAEYDLFDMEFDTTQFQETKTLLIHEESLNGGTLVTVKAYVGSLSTSFTFKVVKDDVDYALECIENCPDIDPSLSCTIKVSCIPSCEYSTFKWYFKPYPELPEKIIYGRNNETITILSNAYTTELTIEGVLVADGFPVMFELQTKNVKPILEIECLSNCVPSNFSLPIELRANCKHHCHLVPPRNRYNWIGLPENHSLIGLQEELILIDANTLRAEDHPVIKVTLSSDFEISAEYHLTEQPKCSSSLDRGISLVTHFRILCTFEDEDLYVFQEIEGHNEWFGVLLYEGDELKDYSFTFSAGIGTRVTVLDNETYHLFNLTLDVIPIYDPEHDSNRSLESLLNHEIITNLPIYVERIQSFQVGLLASGFITYLKFVPSHFQRHYIRHIAELLNSDLGIERTLTLVLKIILLVKELDIQTKSNLARANYESMRKLSRQCCTMKTQHMRRIVSTANFIAKELVLKSLDIEKKLIVEPSYDSDYPAYIDMNQIRVDPLTHVRFITHYVTTCLQYIGGLLDKKKNPLGHFTNNGFPIFNGYVDFGQKIITVDGVLSEVELSSEVIEEFKAEIKMYWQIVLLNPNPFWWQKINKIIHSEIIMFNLFATKTRKTVTYLTNYLDLNIFTDLEKAKKIIVGNLTSDISTVYKIIITPQSTLDLSFEYLNSDYIVLITKRFPTVLEIKRKGIRIKNVTYFHKRLFNLKKSIYIGVARWLGFEPQYAIGMVARKCVSFNGLTFKWSSLYCYVGNRTSEFQTNCRCNHLSIFAVTAFMPPHVKMDLLNKPVHLTPLETHVVFITVAIVFFLWCLLMACAFHRDKNSVVERTLIRRLEDNNTGYAHFYIVCVATGNGPDSQTSANVVIEIRGSRSCSDRHWINIDRDLENTRLECFAIYCANNLGTLKSIRLFHDSDGMRPHWFCQSVTIFHPNTNRKYIFIVDKWFSAFIGCGFQDHEIPLTEKKELETKKIKVTQLFCEEFRDKHLWYSVFYRSNESSFTSKERLTVATTMVLLTMLIAALFYGIGYFSFDEYGTFKMGFNDFRIIVQTLLFVFAGGMLLILLFKLSKPQ